MVNYKITKTSLFQPSTPSKIPKGNKGLINHISKTFLTSDKLMEMRKCIVLKYAWEEEDDSSSAVAVVDSTVAAVGELLGLESTNQSFKDPSLAAMKPMPLQGNGLI